MNFFFKVYGFKKFYIFSGQIIRTTRPRSPVAYLLTKKLLTLSNLINNNSKYKNKFMNNLIN